MKRQIIIFFTLLVTISSSLHAWNIEINGSGDYYRSVPDGSWNGNTGGLFGANISVPYENVGVQLGGSYGWYNWDGRQNVVFKNPRAVQQEGFITAGVFGKYEPFHLALVYDRVFTRHFGNFDLDPSVDQLRYHAGVEFCNEEVGVWGTFALSRSHKTAIGIPVKFKAIDQINLFWIHMFENASRALVWAGVPYGKSLLDSDKRPGTYIIGAAFRAPLLTCLYLDAYGSYMGGQNFRHSPRSQNYAANICLGLTYVFGDGCCGIDDGHLPIANNSAFLIDTSIND